MKRSCTLLLLALLVAALALCLAGLSAPQSAPAPQPTATPEAAYRMLYTRPQQDFDRMAVRLASGEEYTVESSLGFDENGNLLGVYNRLGQPVVVAGQADFALDQTSWQMMLLTAANLPVTASYPGLDPAVCGLDTPAAQIDITYHQGEGIRLTLGQKTASGASCYVQLAGDPQVHLVPADFYDVMTRSLAAHHRLPGPAASAASAVQVAVVRPGQENFIVTHYGTEGRILPWQVDTPFIHAGSTERIQAFAAAISDIHADSYVTSVATAAGLAPYGLDDPTRLLVAFADGAIRDIHLGSDAGDGRIYARLDATGDVYRVDSSLLPDFSTNGTDALLDRFLALISTEQARRVTLRLGMETHVLTITPGEEGATYHIDDVPVSGEVFAPAYTAIVGMQFDKTAPVPSAADPLCEVEFALADGTPLTLIYREHDRYYLHATTSGGGQFLVRRERLEAMLSALKEALP